MARYLSFAAVTVAWFERKEQVRYTAHCEISPGHRATSQVRYAAHSRLHPDIARLLTRALVVWANKRHLAPTLSAMQEAVN